MIELKESTAHVFGAWHISFDDDEENVSEIIQQIWACLEFDSF
jgi:hypothetical protein